MRLRLDLKLLPPHTPRVLGAPALERVLIAWGLIVLASACRAPSKFYSCRGYPAQVESAMAEWLKSGGVGAENLEGDSAVAGAFVQSFLPQCEKMRAVQVASYPAGAKGWLRLDVARDRGGRPGRTLSRTWMRVEEDCPVKHGEYMSFPTATLEGISGRLHWVTFTEFPDSEFLDRNTARVVTNVGISLEDAYPGGRLLHSQDLEGDVRFRILCDMGNDPPFPETASEQRCSLPPRATRSASWNKAATERHRRSTRAPQSKRMSECKAAEEAALRARLSEGLRPVIALLESDDPLVRLRGVEALKKSHGPLEAKNHLVRTALEEVFIRETDSRVRDWIPSYLKDLGGTRNDAVFQKNYELLRSTDRLVQEWAVRNFATMGYAEAIPALRGVLNSRVDYGVRQQAVPALRQLGDHTLFDALLSMLSSADSDDVRLAVGGIGIFLGDAKSIVPLPVDAAQRAVGPLREVLKGVRYRGPVGRDDVVPLLHKMGDTELEKTLIELAKSEDVWEHRIAVGGLRVIKSTLPIPSLASFEGEAQRIVLVRSLIERLRSEEFVKRPMTIARLAEIGPPTAEAVLELINVLNHPAAVAYTHVPEEAMDALRKIAPESQEVVRALVGILEKYELDYPLAQAAARALGRMGPTARAAAPALARLLRSGHGLSCGTAGRALEQLGRGAESVVSDLAHILQASESDVCRMQMADALGSVGPAAADASPALVYALRDKRNWVRGRVWRALWKVDVPPPAVIPALV